jgi:isopentenyl phosphate kinase
MTFSNVDSVTLLKLGGAIITNKEVPMAVREDMLTRLVKEIAAAREKVKESFIIGHGQGSFAHAPALRYQTREGFTNGESQIGMAITQDSAAQLNRIVVNNFIVNHVPAVTFAYSSVMVTDKRKPRTWSLDVLHEYLSKGLVPVTGGDVLVDHSQGCTIWSTEEILAHIARELVKQKTNVKKVIHVTEVSGFLNTDGSIVPEITKENWSVLQSSLTKTKGFDVTGGMGLKVEESLALAEEGVESYIISGLKPNNLYNCLIGAEFEGTTITAKKS